MIYMVDFENVGNCWADVLGQAEPGDTAILFYTDNSPKAMLDQMEKAERQGVSLKFRRCEAGPNGLDFQLSSELGYLAGSGAGAEFCILSNDAGYDVLADYWSHAGIAVARGRVPARKKAIPAGPAPPARTGDHGRDASAWLDRPMTELGLSKSERAHVLGCAKACLSRCASQAERLEKFRADTSRVRGKKSCEKILSGLGPALSALFA